MRFQKAQNLVRLAEKMSASFMGVSLDEIAHEFEVGRRTAERMRDAILDTYQGVEELSLDGRRKSWRIRSPKLNNLHNWSTEDLAALETAAKICKRDGLDQHSASLARIKNSLIVAQSEQKRRAIDIDLESILEAEGIAARSGPHPKTSHDVQVALRDAVLSFKVVEIDYLTRTSNSRKTLRLAPYGFLFGNRHYLVARLAKSNAQDMRLYSLSNISSVKQIDLTFERDLNFSMHGFAERSFGVFQGRKHDFKLRFSKTVAEDVREFHFHKTQKINTNADGSVTVSFKCSGIREVAWHLMTWGEHVEVISPPRLKRMMVPLAEIFAKSEEWRSPDT